MHQRLPDTRGLAISRCLRRNTDETIDIVAVHIAATSRTTEDTIESVIKKKTEKIANTPVKPPTAAVWPESQNRCERVAFSPSLRFAGGTRSKRHDRCRLDCFSLDATTTRVCETFGGLLPVKNIRNNCHSWWREFATTGVRQGQFSRLAKLRSALPHDPPTT